MIQSAAAWPLPRSQNNRPSHARPSFIHLLGVFSMIRAKFAGFVDVSYAAMSDLSSVAFWLASVSAGETPPIGSVGGW
jgi:hypothetical protein